MSTPAPRKWSGTALRQLAVAFAPQEHVGIVGGLLLRLARYLGGDPANSFSITSASTTDVHGLPDNTAAMTAVFHVISKPIAYTVDGTVPTVAASPQVPAGAIFTLRGLPTIRAFQFVSVSSLGSTITGNYFD